MTVGELKAKLEQFPDDLLVLVPNMDWTPSNYMPEMTPARSVCRGINEYDGYLFIDDYMEDEDEDCSR